MLALTQSVLFLLQATGRSKLAWFSKITEQLPPQLEKYGVFVDAGFDEIVSTVAACGLTGVQIHRSSDVLLPFRLRQHFAQFPGRVSILRVLHYKEHGI